jgi:hypothetical protein
MSIWFMLLMSCLNFSAGVSLLMQGRWALAVCFFSYSIASLAMTKV